MSKSSFAARLSAAALTTVVAVSAAVAAPAGGTKTPVLPLPADDGNKIADPIATFSGLDKITGRIISFDVAIDETVQFGALQVTPRVCYSRPPTVAPLTTSFVEVDEITLDNKIRRIFSGWMYADSPGLHAVEHAVYDVWLTDCRAASSESAKPAPTNGHGQSSPQPAPAAQTPAAPAPAQGQNTPAAKPSR